MAPKKGEAPKQPPLIGRFGTSLKIGIVGLPNVGYVHDTCSGDTVRHQTHVGPQLIMFSFPPLQEIHLFQCADQKPSVGRKLPILHD